jgi:putative hydrolase of the HAD superfamily
MKKAVIFDLDNCLAAPIEVGAAFYQPAFDAMRTANQGALSNMHLDEAFRDCWRHSLDWVAEKHGFTEAVRAAGWREFTRLEVSQPLQGYDDLAVLADLPVQRFLVTSGFRRLQESKIRALNIETLFTAIYIDAIDEPGRVGKQGIFARIMAEYFMSPDDILVVGDNADSEIAAGNRLGIQTVQTLRPGVPFTSAATFHIHSRHELNGLLSG